MLTRMCVLCTQNNTEQLRYLPTYIPDNCTGTDNQTNNNQKHQLYKEKQKPNLNTGKLAIKD